MTVGSVRADQGRVPVLLIDDHPLFRQGLAHLINQEGDLIVCGEASDAKEALDLIRATHPRIAVVDITLRESSGLDLLKRLRGQWPELLLLVVSMHDELLYAPRALRAGAQGYVMKREAAEHVMSAIRTLLAGGTYLSREVQAQILAATSESESEEHTSPVDLLSDREFEVFQMLGQGLGTRQIAQQLHLSVRTIEAHREHIKKKLGLQTANELMSFAIHWAQAEQGGK